MKINPGKRSELDRLHSFLAQNGKSLSAIDQAAQFLHQKAYPLEKALDAYADFLELQPRSANAAFNYAWYLSRDGQFEQAINLYRRALELGISQPEEVHLNLGNIYMDHLGDSEKARAEFNRALQLNPRFAGAHHNLGNLAEQMGDRERARVHFEKCLDINPENESALARLSDSQEFVDADDPLLTRLINRAAVSKNSDLHFALGSAFNQLADYEKAWQYFSQANALEKNTLPLYRQEQTETFFKKLAAQCDEDWLASFRVAASEKEAPVFICGMFRTGSTLLEQILASHPGFTAGGESEFFPRLVLREFLDYPDGLDEITPGELDNWRARHAEHLDRLTSGNTRLTDKRPDNFMYIGLIKAIVPSARFVVTERDWRDTALSIFSTRLGGGQNYSTSLANTRHYIDQHRKLIDHWASLLGDDLVRIRYEDLVASPREVIGGLLHALGEEWDERCLSFQELGNIVKTASVWQVREPLHSKSVGRWRNYQPYFEDIFGADNFS